MRAQRLFLSLGAEQVHKTPQTRGLLRMHVVACYTPYRLFNRVVMAASPKKKGM